MLLSMSIALLFCVKLDKQSFVRNVSAKLAFLSLPQHFYQRSSSPCLSFMEATLLLRFSVHYVNVTKTHTEGLLKLSWDLLKIDLLLVVFNFRCSLECSYRNPHCKVVPSNVRKTGTSWYGVVEHFIWKKGEWIKCMLFSLTEWCDKVSS